MEDIFKIVKSLEESKLLIREISEVIKNEEEKKGQKEQKEQKGRFLRMLEQVKEQLELIKIFNAALSLTNFEIEKYYHNKPKFNGVYSRNN